MCQRNLAARANDVGTLKLILRSTVDRVLTFAFLESRRQIARWQVG